MFISQFTATFHQGICFDAMTVQQLKHLSLRKILMLSLVTYKYNAPYTHKLLHASFLKYIPYIKVYLYIGCDALRKLKLSKNLSL